jgi:Secretion system C-terminal sorting domain
MKKLITLLIIIITAASSFAQVKPDFNTAYLNAERNPSIRLAAENLAISKGLPYNIYIKDKAMIEAISVDNGNVVYSVITDFLNPYNGSYCTSFDEIQKSFDFSKARIMYGNKTIDNTGDQIVLNKRTTGSKLYLIPCATRKNVWAFDFTTGDLVDTAFIPYSSPMLQTPRNALQMSKTLILVSDQLSDVVQLYDTSGAYIRVFAPLGGVNNSILDNIRDVEYHPNGTVLVTNAGTTGNALNTVQQFTSTGAYMGVFASDMLNSPYCLLFRSNDLLVSNSSGVNDITKHNINTGAYLGNFLGSALNFPQQMISLPGGKVGVAEFSGVLSGIRIYDSLGVLTDTLKGAQGIRGVWKLPNGNFLATGLGVFEVNGTTGALVRTIVSGSLSYNFYSISVYDPDLITGSNEVNNTVPTEYKLYNNYPNPFNPSTTIKFAIPRKDNVKLTIYDALGRSVSELVNGTKEAGTYEINYNALFLSSGIYFYKLETTGFSEVKKMMLIK